LPHTVMVAESVLVKSMAGVAKLRMSVNIIRMVLSAKVGSWLLYLTINRRWGAKSIQSVRSKIHRFRSLPYRVSLNKRHQSHIGFCENPKPTRPCINYPLPNFGHEKLVFFGKLKVIQSLARYGMAKISMKQFCGLFKFTHKKKTRQDACPGGFLCTVRKYWFSD
jgi:hypothetical protein